MRFFWPKKTEQNSVLSKLLVNYQSGLENMFFFQERCTGTEASKKRGLHSSCAIPSLEFAEVFFKRGKKKTARGGDTDERTLPIHFCQNDHGKNRDI